MVLWSFAFWNIVLHNKMAEQSMLMGNVSDQLITPGLWEPLDTPAATINALDLTLL